MRTYEYSPPRESTPSLRKSSRRSPSALALALLGALVSCGDDDDQGKVNSEEKARRAWQGLDGFVEQSIDLGFKGMAASTSGANIPAQTAAGPKGGMVTVTGKVDQGNSTNKNMDLFVGMKAYAVDEKLKYDTPAEPALQPKITLSLKKLPNGDLTGSVTGAFSMSGELTGTVTLNLMLSAKLEPDGGGIKRVPGSTMITGTAESPSGRYAVMLTR